jgi:hypothetical protein
MKQRGLNDLTRKGFPCSRMIRLHAHPLPPFPELESSCASPVELTDRRGDGWRDWGWSRIIRSRESRPCINHSVHSGVKFEDGDRMDHGFSSINIFSLSCLLYCITCKEHATPCVRQRLKRMQVVRVRKTNVWLYVCISWWKLEQGGGVRMLHCMYYASVCSFFCV